MTTSKLFAVVSHHYCDDHADYEIVEFVTDNEEYAEQWVYGACRIADDKFAYSYDSIELRSV